VPKSKQANAARHPIGVVTERTGLSPHVLRQWERRYGVVRPTRGPAGARLYSDADIERLTLLHRATRAGRAVSTVVALAPAELRDLVAEDAEQSGQRPPVSEAFLGQALEAVRALAPNQLEPVLRRALLSLGAMRFLEDVVAPLLDEVGNEWHDGRITIAHEHAASGTLLQLLAWLTRSLEAPGAASRVVIATPRGESHAFGALMAAVAAAHDGWSVTWLGADLPAAEVASAASHAGARVVALSASNFSTNLDAEVRTLRQLLPPHVPLMVGGGGAGRVSGLEGVVAIRDLTHWRALLRSRATPLPE
jgi:DNA-binding transcriptional MerR regulator/methylmalonyl-CoA mutase cobalamin-binding subunit